MRESYSEGVAIHADPESCGGVREGAVEALTGAHAGQPLSREIHCPRGADVVIGGGRQHRTGRYCETLADPARSKTLCTYGTHLRGNREIPHLTLAAPTVGARIGNPKGASR